MELALTILLWAVAIVAGAYALYLLVMLAIFAIALIATFFFN